MSLLEALNICPDKEDIALPNLPYSKLIVSNEFDPTKYTLEELLSSLITFGYYNINSKNTVEEIVWKLGEKKELFKQYFKHIETKNEFGDTNDYDLTYSVNYLHGLYSVRPDINKIYFNELRQYYPKVYTQEELSVRFVEYDCGDFVVKANNFRLLKWFTKIRLSDWAAAFAAENNNFEMLKWILDNEYLYDYDTCAFAALRGNFEIVKWITEFSKTKTLSGLDRTCEFAIVNNHYDIAEWSLENGHHFTNQSCSYIVLKGNLEQLKWAIKNGAVLHNSAYCNALRNIKNGIKIMQWFLDNNFISITGNFCSDAASYNNFEMLKWLRENNFMWNSKTFEIAFRNGYFDVVKWCIQNECPTNGFMDIYFCDHIDIFIWCIKYGCKITFTVPMIQSLLKYPDLVSAILNTKLSIGNVVMFTDVCIKNNNIHYLKMLHEKGNRLPTNICEMLFRNKHYEVLMWAMNNGYDWDHSDFIDFIDIIKKSA